MAILKTTKKQSFMLSSEQEEQGQEKLLAKSLGTR